jgi:hypothetical protein
MLAQTVISAPLGDFWFDEEGFLYFKGNSAPRTIESIHQHFRVARYILSGRRVCLLADLEDTAPMGREERELMMAEIQNTYKAVAILPNSPLGKVHATAFVILKKSLFPAKMFESEAEARLWLRKYR